MKYLTFNTYDDKNGKTLWKILTVCVVAARPLPEPSDAERNPPSFTIGGHSRPSRPKRWVRAYDNGCRSIVLVLFKDEELYVKNDFREINEYLLAVDLTKE